MCCSQVSVSLRNLTLVPQISIHHGRDAGYVIVIKLPPSTTFRNQRPAIELQTTSSTALAKSLSPTHSTRPTSFLDLPGELRTVIYEDILDYPKKATHLTSCALVGGCGSPRLLQQAHYDKLIAIHGWPGPLQAFNPISDNLAIARVNKGIAAEVLPILYGTTFTFINLDQLNIFLKAIKNNAKYLRDIQLAGPCLHSLMPWVTAEDFTKLHAATSLRSITIPHLHLCGDRRSSSQMTAGRETIPAFVDLILPLVLQRHPTLEDGSILDFLKVAKSARCNWCREKKDLCLEGMNLRIAWASDEMEALFQEVRSKLRSSLAEALGIQES